MELITAASLMTLMMMGVVQIFAIITETASQAQGNAFAMEQGRALLDSIHRDIRGFDRTGYFKIQKSDTNDRGVVGAYTDPGIPSTRPAAGVPIMSKTPGKDYTITWYSSDCLALTSVGYWEGQKDGLRKTLSAEVVYTANVKTPTTRFAVGSATANLDPRRGLLARGVWVVDPTTAATGADGTSTSDRSNGVTLADLGSGKAYDRLSLADGKETGAVSPIKIQPLSDAQGWNLSATDTWQIRRVATSCTSEFCVEALEMPSAGGLPTWTRRPAGWTVSPISGTDKECPRAIRVTIASHDPSDKKPQTGPSKRYEGYALQEVFWISDP